MARNKTLGQILTLYRQEARISSNPAHNADVRDAQVAILQRLYESLWEDNDWEHLKIERDYQLQTGQRLYSFNTDFDLSRIYQIKVKDGGEWVPLRPQITPGDRATYESALGEQAWPVRAFQVTEGEQIEMWPIPDRDGDAATLDGYVRVYGMRKLPAFVADGDVCLIDDRIIALYAAAEHFFASEKEKIGAIKMGIAERRKTRLLGAMNKVDVIPMFKGQAAALSGQCPGGRPMTPTYRTGDAT